MKNSINKKCGCGRRVITSGAISFTTKDFSWKQVYCKKHFIKTFGKKKYDLVADYSRAYINDKN